MTALGQLQSYLDSLKVRLRVVTTLRGVAIGALSALLLTVALVAWIDRNKFADGAVWSSRVLLAVGVLSAICLALILPLKRLTRSNVVRGAEQRTPSFGQCLLTLTERPEDDNPFRELIAAEALDVAHAEPSAALPRTEWIYVSASAAAIVMAAFVWLISAGPGIWGYGASLLWTGHARAGSPPIYSVAVQPGNRTIRRHSNQVITARLHGFSTANVSLHARYRGALKWNVLPMQQEGNQDGYQVLFAGLTDALDYYVQADEAKSPQFTLGVKDLPSIKRISVSVQFPSGLGLQNISDVTGGDIRAVIGSEAQVRVKTDRPLQKGLLHFDSGKQIPLLPDPNGTVTAHFGVEHDGSYYIASEEDGEVIRLSDDFYVEAKKDEAPSVRIVNPGHDPHVSPIEEMAISAEAVDDFGVDALDLHYSVNGGPEQVRSLRKASRSKELSGKTTLSLEDFNLSPGDLVSVYATAHDKTHTAKSDMLFAQADPFDFKFQQSQQAGGGGGGGGSQQDAQISARQKELIAATWNQLKSPTQEHSAIAENGRFLSDMEQKLGAQAKTLAERMSSRDLSGLSPQFEQFAKSMTAASDLMTTAESQLRPGKWNDALPPEQQALKSLLRAESIFRDIQVSYGQQNGGGGGANGADRDLARMLDLELDTAKNQYESSKSASMPDAAEKQKQMDDAMQRLKDLAKRQQELAEQRNSIEASQQRWEEEQLRREAEELKQKLQQLAKNNQSDGSSSGQSEQSSAKGQEGRESGGSQSSNSASSQGKQNDRNRQSEGQQMARGDSSPADNAGMQRSMQALERAEQEMRNSVSKGDSAASKRAASELAAAQDALRNGMRDSTGQSVSDLHKQAEQLASNQRDLANRVKQLYGAGGINMARNDGDGKDGSTGKAEMPEMNSPGFSGRSWWRQRFTPERERPASAAEKAYAAESEKLSARMQQLQSQMQGEMQHLNSQEPDAARKMREALSDAEQNELSLRMQKSGEWLRKGYGSQTWPQQDSITAGLDQLTRQLQQSQSALSGKGGKEDEAGNAQNQKMADALSQVQALRQQLEAKANDARGRNESAASRQDSGSQSRQPGSQQQNSGKQASSSQGKSSPTGQPSSSDSSEEAQGYSPLGGGGEPRVGGRGGSQATDSTLSQLQNLKSTLGGKDRQLDRYMNNAIGSLRQTKGQAGLLDARINDDAVTSLERLELELTRRLTAGDAGARVGNGESAPDAYRAAVADYFKKLSK